MNVLPISNCRLPIAKTSGFVDDAAIQKKLAIGNWQSAIREIGYRQLEIESWIQ